MAGWCGGYWLQYEWMVVEGVRLFVRQVDLKFNNFTCNVKCKNTTTTANESLLMSSDCILNVRVVWQWDGTDGRALYGVQMTGKERGHRRVED